MARFRPSPAASWLAFLAFGGMAAIAYVAVSLSRFADMALFEGVVGIAVVAALLGRRDAEGHERAAWTWTLASLVCFMVCEVFWQWRPNLALGPFQSAADTGFLLSSLPLAGAASHLVSAREKKTDRSAWVEVGMMTLALVVVSWDVLIDPYLKDSRLSTTDLVAAVAPPAAAIIAFGFVLRLVMSRHLGGGSSTAFTLGASLMICANLVVYRHGAGDGFKPGSLAAGIVLFGSLLVGFAAPRTPWGFAPNRGTEGLGRVRSAIVLAGVFAPAGILARALGQQKLLGLNTITVAIGTVILMIGLAAVSQVRLIRRARAAEAHRAEARLSALVMHAAEAIFLIDVEARISFASPSGEALCGKRSKALFGQSLLSSFIEDHRAAVASQLRILATMPTGATVPIEGHVVGRGRGIRILEGTCQNLLDDPNVGAIVVTLRDTTSRHELEQQLERRAFHDDLTGLANRALFADRLSHALKRSARNEAGRLAVLFIDLDDFKAVNDGMGHGAGDEFIRGVAERIRASVRPADTVARLGGDEFAVLLEDTQSLDLATQLAERLLEKLKAPIEVLGVGLPVPASCGVTYAVKDSTVESLLRDADIAMYSAKSQGKGRVAVFDTRLHDIAVRRLALKVELPEALAAENFRVAYQPIRTITDQTLRGFEALVRWHHPTRGLISPAEFIPAAENTGMIVELGRWVLARACEETVFWNRRSPDPFFISVNVSGIQLHQPGFVDDVRQILDETGLPARLLNVELTESVLVKHQHVEAILNELREVGVGIAIDDFGTGYSSLSYLQQFPATSIKVDRSFVSGLGEQGDVGLVRSIISIADSLGLKTVAEGVETIEQLEVLRGLGCEYAQGFLLGRPQAAGEITGMLEIERMSRTSDLGGPVPTSSVSSTARIIPATDELHAIPTGLRPSDLISPRLPAE